MVTLEHTSQVNMQDFIWAGLRVDGWLDFHDYTIGICLLPE
jgi:hypothetical protein